VDFDIGSIARRIAARSGNLPPARIGRNQNGRHGSGVVRNSIH
jgi:hypothetical protein